MEEHQEFLAYFFYPAFHWRRWLAYSAIRGKAIGCWSCRPGTAAHLALAGTRRAPRHNDFTGSGASSFLLEQQCAAIKKPSAPLSSFQHNPHSKVEAGIGTSTYARRYWHTYLARDQKDGTVTEIECFEKTPNCAACGASAPHDCILCFDGHALVNVTDTKGNTSPQCLKDYCPSGYKKFVNNNGFMYCEPCGIDNCAECSLVTVNSEQATASHRQGKSHTTKASPAKKTIEICLRCEGSYQLGPSKSDCLDTSMYIQLYRRGSRTSVDTKRNYVVRALPEKSLNEIFELLRSSESSSAGSRQLFFLQQALYEINKMAGYYTEVEATIWLTKGDHYFFQCSELVRADAPKTPLEHDRLCQFQSLKVFHPKTDNVKLVVRALRCDSKEASSIKEAKNDKAWFKSNCVANDSERPIVYVNAPNFYFNITKEAIFEDVIFDAVNTFGHTFAVDGNGRRASPQQTPFWPMKMCELNVSKS